MIPSQKPITKMTTTLLENCHISPPPEVVSELTLPLTFLDLPWISFHPIRRLLFYESPCSKPYFLDTIVPQLKQSLSLTLKHYLPLASNFLFPLNTDENKPLIRYLAGDSVPVTIAESDKDFEYLTAYHMRDSDDFYDFVPRRPPVKEETEYKLVPALALQVTLFPGRGLCIGISNLHSVGDASSIFGFIKTWASINKSGGDEEFLKSNNESLPIFDKSLINDPLGIDSIFWNAMKTIPFNPETFPLPTERVRATFVLNPVQIKKLKDLVQFKNPGLGHLSSFVVATAYVWTCFVKSGEEVERDEFFIFVADVRARVSPPVPGNYFGNCLAYGMAKIGQKELVGEEGFVLAATAIAEDIKNRVNNKDEVLKGAENWFSDIGKYMGISSIGISGSPKFDLYGVDFGWGKAKKVEVVTIDSEKYSMSLSKSRDFEGGLEFGFSLPKERLENFAAVFVEGLKFS